MSEQGSTIVAEVHVFSGDPTDVSTAIINPKKGDFVIDKDTPALYQKTSARGDNSGYIRIANDIPHNAQTDAYTLVLADRNKLVTINHASAKAWTIPPNSDVAFPIGTEIAGAQLGAGTVTVTAGSGVTIRSKGALVDSAGQYATWSVKKIGTNEWLLTGALA